MQQLLRNYDARCLVNHEAHDLVSTVSVATELCFFTPMRSGETSGSTVQAFWRVVRSNQVQRGVCYKKECN